MPFVRSGDARIHWRTEGSGTPVLLIMGHLYSSAMWYPLVADLAQRHRVILFDNRGTGASDTRGTVTIEQMAADALAVLDAAGEARAHVFGVSMGGGIAGEFAMAWPERCLSLTLGCTLIKTDRETRGRSRPFIYWLPGWLVRRLMRRLATPAGYGSAAPEAAARHDIARLAQDRFTMRGARAQNRAITEYVTTRERAQSRLTMPVLILHGDEDQLVDVKYGFQTAEMLPHARLKIFAGAGHNFLVAAGAEANRAFIDFIDNIDAGRAAA